MVFCPMLLTEFRPYLWPFPLEWVDSFRHFRASGSILCLSEVLVLPPSMSSAELNNSEKYSLQWGSLSFSSLSRWQGRGAVLYPGNRWGVNLPTTPPPPDSFLWVGDDMPEALPSRAIIGLEPFEELFSSTFFGSFNFNFGGSSRLHIWVSRNSPFRCNHSLKAYSLFLFSFSSTTPAHCSASPRHPVASSRLSNWSSLLKPEILKVHSLF